MEKINVKNILIIMLILVEVIATYFMYKSGTNKEVVLDNVELKELTDNNSFAIYLDGKEYNQTTWPASATFQKAECQNEKGDILNGILTFNEEENKAYVKNITQTLYCYLYFTSDNTLPTCSLKLEDSNLVWNSKSDDKTTNLKYILTNSNTSPSNFTNNTSLSISQEGTYYGYVQDEAGNIGKCSIDIKNKNNSKCTVESTYDYFTNCISYEYYCSSSSQTGNHYTWDDNTLGCNGSTSGTTMYDNCPTNPTGTYSTCSCSKTTKYSCSDGNTYSSETACTSATCGEVCPAGYIETSKYCYKPGEGTTTPVDPVDPPKPGGQAPTCSLSVTTSGVSLIKGDDATQYGMSTSSSATYNSETSLSLSAGNIYGFVKNDYGTGSCSVLITYTTQGSEGTYYTWNESTCSQTGSTSTYSCCKAASSSSATCPSGYSNVSGYCAKNGTAPTTCSSGTQYSSSSGMCRSYTAFVCPDGTSDNGTTCSKVISASQTNYGSLQQCTNKCTKGNCTNSGVCISCPNGDPAFTHIDGQWSCRTYVAKDDCPNGYNKGSNQCWKNSGSPTCGSKTNISGTCYDTTSPTSGGYTCSSGDSLSGNQCCRSSSSTLSGYSCTVSSTTPTYGWGSSTTASGTSCPSSTSSCSASTVGSKQVSGCQQHSSGTYYYCSDNSYTWLNNTYCYKTLS